jgi:hypothetical protein
MVRNRSFVYYFVVLAFLLSGVVLADVSLQKAKKIGEDNLKSLIDQSYHYRVEYDTILVLPVYSKTIWKDDFYLLYFLKNDYFQAEMEVDKKTGKPSILAMGTMAPPYLALHTGTFNYRYFSADSIMYYASLRNRVKQDSARLVYFGVIPRLGKRGVVWEVFSSRGTDYISPGGPNFKLYQLIADMNLSQRRGGNFAADSIRMIEINAEIKRLQAITDEELHESHRFPKTRDSLITSLMDERQVLITHFPKLGQLFPLEEKQK